MSGHFTIEDLVSYAPEELLAIYDLLYGSEVEEDYGLRMLFSDSDVMSDSIYGSDQSSIIDMDDLAADFDPIPDELVDEIPLDFEVVPEVRFPRDIPWNLNSEPWPVTGDMFSDMFHFDALSFHSSLYYSEADDIDLTYHEEIPSDWDPVWTGSEYSFDSSAAAYYAATHQYQPEDSSFNEGYQTDSVFDHAFAEHPSIPTDVVPDTFFLRASPPGIEVISQ